MILYYLIGAALGGVMRFWFERFSYRFVSKQFPLGTLLANWIGSWLLGVLVVVQSTYENFWWLSSAISFTAAFTTFGGFIGQSVLMFKEKRWIAVLYLFATVFGSLGLFWLGYSA